MAEVGWRGPGNRLEQVLMIDEIEAGDDSQQVGLVARLIGVRGIQAQSPSDLVEATMVHHPPENLPGRHRERKQPRQGVEVLRDEDEVVVIDREKYSAPASPQAFEKRKQLGRRRVDHELIA